jgi:hypothetical protein
MRLLPTCLCLSLALCLSLTSALTLGAQQSDGGASEGGIFLLLPVGAKAVALGRAMTALPGAESVFWNPAGLGDLSGSRVLLYRGDYVAGEGTSASGLVSRAGLGTIGATYHLLDVGEQDLTDEQGNVLGTISVRNHLGVFSAATRFWNRLNVGFNFKFVQFSQSCRGQCLDAGVTATTYAVDVGLQLTGLAGLPLRLGVMVAQAGPRFQVRNEEQADPLPTRVRASAAYEIIGTIGETDHLSLMLITEVEDRWRDFGSPALYLGSEFAVGVEEALLVVRAGYVRGNGEQVDGAAIGVGIEYDRFDLSIAKSLAANITGVSDPVHVTFGIGF